MNMVFWLSISVVFYTYFVYPSAIYLLAYLRPAKSGESVPAPTSVSFVIAARNEGMRTFVRVRELVEQLDRAAVEGEVILVLDGAGQLLRVSEMLADDDRIRVIEIRERQGKAAAISAGAKVARYEVLALADVRQQWQADALHHLLQNFRDSRVGAVSGDLVLLASNGITAGVGLYWRYEKWIRRSEATLDSVVGVTGAICAVRRNLFHGVPAGTILDDVYWPLCVVQQGYRVVHDSTAIAFDRLPEKPRDEFRRKVRTLSGNFQLVYLMPSLLLPWRNRIVYQFVSHKLLRLAVPWLLVVALLACSAGTGTLYGTLFGLQAIFYGMCVLLMTTAHAGSYRVTSAVAAFALLNVAAWCAFWVWISGRAGKTWDVAAYGPKAANR